MPRRPTIHQNTQTPLICPERVENLLAWTSHFHHLCLRYPYVFHLSIVESIIRFTQNQSDRQNDHQSPIFDKRLYISSLGFPTKEMTPAVPEHFIENLTIVEMLFIKHREEIAKLNR